MSKTKKVLIISHDKIGSSMAGPGIRYHFMAKVLVEHFDVTVGFFDETYLPDPAFERSYQTIHFPQEKYDTVLSAYDVVISMWLSDEMLTFCRRNNTIVVFDMYAPVPVENLALFMFGNQKIRSDIDYTYMQSYSMYSKFFRYGDYFLFSNSRQKDFWTGYIFGGEKISVSSYLKRPLYDRFLLAPMGIDTSTTLKHTDKVLRGVIDGINQADKVLIWTGGIWNWFDAQTLIKAMALLKDSHPSIKLVFFGTKHPNPNVPEMKEASDALELAREKNLLNQTVFLMEGWVPYEKRLNYLLEADAAVNTTKSEIEAEFSHRTRVLDHILTTLPTIANTGDYLTDAVIVPQNLGVGVKPADERALANAIVSTLNKKALDSMKKNIAIVRPSFDWHCTLKPLVDTLLNDKTLTKLPVLDPLPRQRLSKVKAYKIAKKITPIPVKKMILRVIKHD